MTAIIRTHRAVILVAIVAFTAALLVTPFVRVHGWDWTVGTSTSYCGAYLPHGDFYCQSGS